jgi:site-specific recombinase XerD
MGLFKICHHKGRARERCDCPWHGGFRGRKVSLPRWANREIQTKDDAEAALSELKTAVRAGTFDPRGLKPGPVGVVTFRAFADRYWDRHAKNLRGADTVKNRLEIVARYFDGRAVPDLKAADLDDLFTMLGQPARLTPTHKRDRVRSTATINRFRSLAGHMFRWAVEEEILERSPFKRRHRPQHEDNRRHRRLSGDDEKALLDAAPSFLRNLIVAALDTGMRRGEMLQCSIADLDARPGWIRLRGTTTKSAKTRYVPVATDRLRQVLDWQRLDAAGLTKPDTAFVFCNGVGERRTKDSFQTVWRTTKRMAGVADYHWHDLRHEYGSRLTEDGVALSKVRDLMGHASITTTERYDNQRQDALEAAAKQLEGKVVQFLSSDTPSAEDSQSEADAEPTANLPEDLDLVIGVDDGTRTRNVRSHSPVLYL